ncbi:MAG TPA: hypothetical protein VFV58_18805 [Blastocatellia bacterium]|jgi:preprotein translocase subunit SecF|nr:hypothetical protein [Blastocatellia bacterium]
MVEIFKDANYDLLGKKWLFIGFSLLFLLAGAISIAWRVSDGDPSTRAFNLGIDFTGGALVNAKFKAPPDLGRLRSAIERQGIESSKITLQPVRILDERHHRDLRSRPRDEGLEKAAGLGHHFMERMNHRPSPTNTNPAQ